MWGLLLLTGKGSGKVSKRCVQLKIDSVQISVSVDAYETAIQKFIDITVNPETTIENIW